MSKIGRIVEDSSQSNLQPEEQAKLTIEWDEVFVLSREASQLCESRVSAEKSQGGRNPESLALSQENNGQPIALSNVEDGIVTVKVTDPPTLAKENSDIPCLSTRENSGFLGTLVRETSEDIQKLLADATASDLPDAPCETFLCRTDNIESDSAQPHPELQSLRHNSSALDGSSKQPTSPPEQLVDDTDATKNSPAPAKRGSRRGVHVRERPQMQQTARAGAMHWAARVRLVRAAWAQRAESRPAFRDQYHGQVEAAQGRIKSKQECLLRFLQMAADDCVVTPDPFGPGGFFGWRRFTVAAGRAPEFRRSLEALFPAGFREDTLKETFRRAGLIPERWQWGSGWRGAVAFEYRQGRADDSDGSHGS